MNDAMHERNAPMPRRRFPMVCALLLLVVAPPLAHATRAMADPISGTWTGALTPAGGPPPTSVTFQLKFDGKDAVSGTFSGLPSPGDVKKGTFNAKTGALKLELGKKDDSAVLLTLEGIVAKDVATGKFDGEMSGEFKLTRRP